MSSSVRTDIAHTITHANTHTYTHVLTHTKRPINSVTAGAACLRACKFMSTSEEFEAREGKERLWLELLRARFIFLGVSAW